MNEQAIRQSAGATQAQTGNAIKQPKHSTLFNLIHDLREVRDHVRNLHSELGAQSAPQPDCDKVGQEPPNNLVDVINRLPGMVNRECAEIRGLLNEIQESLV